MRTAYAPFFRVRIRHAFYANDLSTGDFRVEPSPSTRRLLKEHGLRLMPAPDGFSLAGPIDPETLRATAGQPPAPVEPSPLGFTGSEQFRMCFYLVPQNPNLGIISDVGSYRPGSTLFYFDNLRTDLDDGRLYLGDSVAARRLGSPVELATSSTYSFPLDPAVRSAGFSVRDAFGNVFDAGRLTVPDHAPPAVEYRIDLDRLEKLLPGRIVVSSTAGGDRSVYYDPELFGVRPFGVVEVSSGTRHLTPDQSDLVPVAYRMFEGSRLRGVEDFHIQLEARATVWRYRVTKKYDADAGLDLATLAIDDGSTFTKTAPSPEFVVFESNAPRALSERPAGLELKHGGGKPVRTLPSPGPTTPLTREESADQDAPFVSELFIYV